MANCTVCGQNCGDTCYRPRTPQPKGFSDLEELVKINLKYRPLTTLTLRQILEQQAMLTAFRHAGNSIGIATGTIISHVAHDEAAKSVTGDHYFLELIAESELRYKRLKAAAEPVLRDYVNAIDMLEHIDEAAESRELANSLQEALK
jgi:hypothetical protein